MVSYMTQAIAWGVARVLGRPHGEPVPHDALEHAHWNRVEHRWYTHDDHTEEAAGRAA